MLICTLTCCGSLRRPRLSIRYTTAHFLFRNRGINVTRFELARGR